MTDGSSATTEVTAPPDPGGAEGARASDGPPPLLAAPASEGTPPAPRLGRPWPRYWARLFDATWMIFALSILAGLLVPAAAGWNDALLGLMLLPLACLLEVALYLATGGTPGKWVVGLRVRGLDGRRLGLRAALVRTARLYLSGLGLGIPVVALFTLVRSYGRAGRGELQPWDAATDARCLDTAGAPWRTFAGAAAAVLFIVGLRLFGAWVATPAGQVTVAIRGANAMAPRLIDPETRLDEVRGDRARVQYLYTMLAPAGGEPPTAESVASRQPAMLGSAHRGACRGAELALFRSQGATIQHTYRSASGAMLLDLVIAPDDCRTDSTVVQGAAEVNTRTPMMIDEMTRLDGARASGRRLQYLYTLPQMDQPEVASQKEFGAAFAALRRQIAANLCRAEEMKPLREAGTLFQYTFRTNGGAVLADFEIPSEECP